MKAVLPISMLVLCLWSTPFALAQIPKDIRDYPTCIYCGMNRQHFSYSRMLIEYEDKSSFGACSLHCAAINLAINTDKVPLSILVADYNTAVLIDAEEAYWVTGGSKPGVMTQSAKWAFRNKEDAAEYIKKYGGSLTTFEKAINAAYMDMYRDSRMIRGKRKLRKTHL